MGVGRGVRVAARTVGAGASVAVDVGVGSGVAVGVDVVAGTVVDAAPSPLHATSKNVPKPNSNSHAGVVRIRELYAMTMQVDAS